MAKQICPICSEVQLVERVGDFKTKYADRRGVEQSLVVPNVRRLHCEACNEEILDDTATRQVESARRAAVGLLSAAEIRDLRLRFGKTQVQMSRLLGVGEKTYCRWESGSFIQSVAFDNYMRLIRDVPEASVRLSHLDLYGVFEPPHFFPEEENVFAFLPDIGRFSEPGAKFTQQLVAGTLHTSLEYRL
jgi:putative zinc finger/helix-turn-helix YgiT family protein